MTRPQRANVVHGRNLQRRNVPHSGPPTQNVSKFIEAAAARPVNVPLPNTTQSKRTVTR